MFSLICAWINGRVNNRKAGDLRHYRAHYDVIVMTKVNRVLRMLDGHRVLLRVDVIAVTLRKQLQFVMFIYDASRFALWISQPRYQCNDSTLTKMVLHWYSRHNNCHDITSNYAIYRLNLDAKMYYITSQVISDLFAPCRVFVSAKINTSKSHTLFIFKPERNRQNLV